MGLGGYKMQSLLFLRSHRDKVKYIGVLVSVIVLCVAPPLYKVLSV